VWMMQESTFKTIYASMSKR